MRVSQVIALARRWVEENGSALPGFHGAYLAGSINQLSKDTLFPSFRDVDIYIVVDDSAQIANPHEKLLYEGLLLEPVCLSLEEHRSPETVLASANAGNIACCEVLSDPTGLLQDLRRNVAEHYAQREWIAARCGAQKELLFQELDRADSADDTLFSLCLTVLFLGGVMALACLRTPTVRRCLALTRELLQDRGRPKLHDEMLELLGCAHLEREQVIYHLQECIRSFDRSVEVVSTPFLGSWNLHTYARPYLVDGSYEMIDAGRHREAMLWISNMHCFANQAIQNDAPEAEKSHCQERIGRLQAELGISTTAEWGSRIKLARSVSDSVLCFVEEVLDDTRTRGWGGSPVPKG